MKTNTPDTMLIRIDPTRNMRRFYSMTIQPNLFGGLSMMWEWGWIGSSGQLRIKLFNYEQSAIEAQHRLHQSKQNRGHVSRKVRS